MYEKKKTTHHITLLEVDGSRGKYPQRSYYVPGHGIVTKIEKPPMTRQEMWEHILKTQKRHG